MARALWHIEQMNAPRFITLTVRSTNADLRQALDNLRASFAKLRRHQAWKDRVCGGVYTLEITFNKRTGQWHPHLHLIVEGSYFPQDELKSAWHQATGDSFIVDIRAVHDRAKAAAYIASYVSKGSDPDAIPHDRLVQWLDGVTGVRFLQTFGSHHGKRPPSGFDDDPAPIPTTTYIGPVNEIVKASDAGDDDAEEMYVELDRLRRSKVPDIADPAYDEFAARIGSLVSRLRTWFNDPKGHNRGDPPTPGTNPSRHPNADDRQLRLGEILASPIHH
jgi:hypothetical protein